MHSHTLVRVPPVLYPSFLTGRIARTPPHTDPPWQTTEEPRHMPSDGYGSEMAIMPVQGGVVTVGYLKISPYNWNPCHLFS
jgi:hypothetical protein